MINCISGSNHINLIAFEINNRPHRCTPTMANQLQRTLALIKPDAINDADAIVELASQNGFTVLEVRVDAAYRHLVTGKHTEQRSDVALSRNSRCCPSPLSVLLRCTLSFCVAL